MKQTSRVGDVVKLTELSWYESVINIQWRAIFPWQARCFQMHSLMHIVPYLNKNPFKWKCDTYYINFIKNARGQAVTAGYSVFSSCFCMFSHVSFILYSVTGMPALSESVFVPAEPREHFEFMEEDVQVWIFEFGHVTGCSLKKKSL